MNSDSVKTIKRAIPLGVFCLAGWYTYKKRENIQESILFGGIVALLAYLIFGPIVDKIVSAAGKPSDVNYNTSNIPQGWNPEPLARRIFNDVHGMRSPLSYNSPQLIALYREVNALNNDQLVSLYNYWKDHYYSEHSELTLTEALQDESFGILGQAVDDTKAIISRLHALQCP